MDFVCKRHMNAEVPKKGIISFSPGPRCNWSWLLPPEESTGVHWGHLHLSPPIFPHICVTSDHDVIKYEPRIIMTAMMLGPRMKLLIWAEEEDVVTSHFWTGSVCTTLQLIFWRNTPALSPSRPDHLCPHVLTMWSNGAWQNNASEEKQEAEPAERVYRGGLHVAPVTRASKTRSVWCGFTEFHYHEILLCGCTAICVGVKIGVINRCAISRYIGIPKVWIVYVCI